MTFLSDLRFALRSLARARGLVLTVVLTLALGIGANAAIFTVVQGVLLRPLANRDEHRLVYIRQSAPGIGMENAAFSIPELYRLAGRLRATRGGAAVVLGALSPRARNAQVAMFQAGEVDYLVATDAIGMGLNLDVSHVAFASLRKFDGQHARHLSEPELAQIAGRAGRYLQDGSFGTLHPTELPLELAERIEQHAFEPIRRVRFRSSALDFSSPEALLAALEAPPKAAYLASVPTALDVASLRKLLRVVERVSVDINFC